MKIFWNVFLLMFILGLAVEPVSAQKEEEEITESSEIDSDIYVDDIVQKRLIFENRVLPYEPIR